MNLQFLGDALDHWKGSVFETLQKSSLLIDFRVDAMASDSEEWEENDRRLYTRLLKIEQHQLIAHRNILADDRNKYFSEIPSVCDLFLDPDTGLKTGKVKIQSQYLKMVELCQLLEQNKNRIVVVYQHVRARRTRDRVVEVLRSLSKEKIGFFCTSYESSTVALLFFGLESKRIKTIREHFRHLLNKHANMRIGYWCF